MDNELQNLRDERISMKRFVITGLFFLISVLGFLRAKTISGISEKEPDWILIPEARWL
jgi:hypothetical protein